MISRCIRAMKAKTNSSKGQPEKDFAETLDGYKDTLLVCKGAFAREVANLLPTTYTQALTLLDHTGNMRHCMSEGKQMKQLLTRWS